MIRVTVCKCPEGASLWEESAVDAATCRENLVGEETHRLLNVRLSLGSLETGCTTEWLFALQVAFVWGNLTTFYLEFRTGMYLT